MPVSNLAPLAKDPSKSLNDLGSPIEGVGIHTGQKFRVRLAKGKHNEFLRFVGIHPLHSHAFESPALWSRLSGTARSTALVLRSAQSSRKSISRFELKTIEHFMAAYHVLGLRGYDLYIEALSPLNEGDAFEMPILEGASLQWLKWLESCVNSQSSLGAAKQDRPVWIVARSFEVKDSFKKVLLLPHENPADTCTRFHCAVDFYSKWAQQISFDLDWSQIPKSVEAFRTQIAPARTFGFEHELKELEKRGLAIGGSMQNALLLNHDRVLNEGGFCLPQELAAHKLLDAIGDFSLLGAPLIGRIELQCAGHAMHLRTLTEAVRKGALKKGRIDSQGKLSLIDDPT